MSPRDEYRRRLTGVEEEIARLRARDERIANLRLFLFAGALVLAALAWYWQLFTGWWLAAPAVLFVALAIRHAQVQREWIRAERVAAHYRHALARIEDRWAGLGQTGERFSDPHHVYAADLDLFGKGSLFDLLSTARTRAGEETLARWLLAPATLDEIRRRQACVEELASRLDLRRDLAILGQESRVGVQPTALLDWCESTNLLNERWLKILAVAMPIAAAIAVGVWAAWGWFVPFLIVLLLEGALLRSQSKRLGRILSETEHAFEDLNLLAQLPGRIEREPAESAALTSLIGRLSSHGIKASNAISRLATIVQFMESRRNFIIQVIALPTLYTLQVALAAERWKRLHGHQVRDWLDAIGEIEALLSLAAYRYEHPDDPMPKFVDGPGTFRARALGHPLLAPRACVRNDVEIADPTRLLLISGSNMSGKSTLLRTIGINTVLAMAGAPVRAASVELSALQVGASIRVNDSLQEGSSRFYAEITRLRQLYELTASSTPLLFLLDELLQGTNSHDRRAGAEGIVRAFVDRGAIGLVSTHDLALTDLVPDGRLRNQHFEDEFTDGRLVFDFKLRDGVVNRSNGLALMRSIGLDV
jgi:hypothetical protein